MHVAMSMLTMKQLLREQMLHAFTPKGMPRSIVYVLTNMELMFFASQTFHWSGCSA